MKSPDLYMGLGSVVYALAKVDGRLQAEEDILIRRMLLEEPHGELAMQSFLLREHYNESVEEAYAFGMRRFVANRKEIDGELKKHFVSVLMQAAESNQDVSRKEQELIKRFRRDLRRL
jgi:uncharacterized tellurite resistance protein B-like protein